MCGLAGIVTWDDRFHISESQLHGMSACIAHRGPDAAGLWLNHDREATPLHPQCGLAHRRLAILDLDHRADQPFQIGQRRLVFNGEIYNFPILRKELEQLLPNYQWRTTGDTEVLLAAFDAWGEGCVEHLDGMFAIAIWDDATGSLFLARDRMGQKPLYVAFVEEQASTSSGATPKGQRISAVAFASELPALLDLPWVSRNIANDALVEYLQWGYIPSPLTIYDGAWRLRAARTMTITHRGAIDRTYFDPNVGEVGERQKAEGRTRELLTAAVGRQMISDVPMGCFLSGGIDSSIVALLMRKHASDVRTFSIAFEDPRYDESAYAQRVATHLGTTHETFTVRPDAAADLPKLAAAFGEPFGDSSALPTYYLSRETRQHVKVALSGDGGDELFGGYDRYRAMAITQGLRSMLTPVGSRAVASIAALLPGVHPKSKSTRIKRLLSAVHLPASQRYSHYTRLFDNATLHRLLQPAVRDYFWLEWDRIATHMDAAIESHGAIKAAMAADKLFYLPDDLLVKVDRASMQFALEVRSPFLDPALVTLAAGLSGPDIRQKRLLRQAFAADLPAEVFQRPKMGFALPIGEWFRTNLREMLHDTLLASNTFIDQVLQRPVIEELIEDHESRHADHTQRLYALLQLELWAQNRPHE
jgi:asparagine synthase (glutamine-hydrolysing)